ncbi:hypothetical protein U9M48_034183 [Paspalum notatum var. saurae]|uniref:Uncharacterized protein n=1 Tax=Paspalum notatum var. saurae TaxID=547442 RepID=A0AAQ3X7N6_PASNO
MALAPTAGDHDAVPVTTMPDDDFAEDDVVVLDDLVDVHGWGVDLDAADEFCDAYTAFLLANSKNKIADGAAAVQGTGWMAGPYGDGEGEGSSPGTRCSGVTAADGPLPLSSSAGDGDDDDEEEAMLAAYVNALERFLLMDGDGGFGDDMVLAAACPDGGGGQQAEGGLLSVGDCFGDDPLLAGGEAASVVEAPAGGGGGGQLKNGEDDEEDEHDDLDAREDGRASRKRARNKIKGTSMMPWGELEVTRMHLARIHLPPPPLVCCV